MLAHLQFYPPTNTAAECIYITFFLSRPLVKKACRNLSHSRFITYYPNAELVNTASVNIEWKDNLYLCPAVIASRDEYPV